ncbi:MAG: aspartate aminotransferase family protein [Rhodobacteraceae bacterium]|nr:aspartate aminotransferase family protein [Paracoccaceae bacterium]
MDSDSDFLPTETLQDLDAAHHMHPFTDGGALNAERARVVAAADGVMITDTEGKTYLDGMAGLWCVNIGYGRHELPEVAARQMRQLPYYNTFFHTTNRPAVALSQKLAEVTPGNLSHSFFAGSGSEANDSNLRIVRRYWEVLGKPGKTIVISRKNAYHGSTMGSASMGGMAYMHSQGGLPIPDITHIGQPYWYGEGEGTDEAEFGLVRARELETEIRRLGEDRVAAFIAEPVLGAGGVIIPPDTYWPEIQRICDAYEILLIVDEVICGFGRTGNWFGSDTFGIRPDIVTVAKGLSSGYVPIGASVVSGEIANTLYDSGEFNHGYTYSGHPVACAVALENIRILQEENIIAYSGEVAAPYLAERWATLGDHPLVGEARSCGLMAAIELTPDKATRAAFKGEAERVGGICRENCFRNGLIMRSVLDSMVISPPLIITKDEIDLLVERAGLALDETLEEAARLGLMS